MTFASKARWTPLCVGAWMLASNLQAQEAQAEDGKDQTATETSATDMTDRSLSLFPENDPSPAPGDANDVEGQGTDAASTSTVPRSASKSAPPPEFLAAPTPYLHSYRRANSIDGKIGIGTLWMRTDPFGAASGYGQVFVEGDWNGIGETSFGLHVDLDARTLLYEPRDPKLIDVENGAVDVLEDDAYTFYRRLGTYDTGRSYDYLRLDKLNVSWESDAFGLILGRMWVDAAAQAPVDGFHLHLGLGDWGRLGIFGGLKTNPWHQQLVGANSGGSLWNGAGQLLPVLWGDVNKDTTWLDQEGATSNEIGFGLPWTHVASLRFLTSGIYGQIRAPSLFLDSAMVVDLFDTVQLDRVWGHARGGVRISRDLMLAFRGTLDVMGARPLFPRDLYLDLSWRNLGPLSLRLNYTKYNTLATAYSYGAFFRPLEDPNGTVLENNPWGPNADAAFAAQQALYATPAEQVFRNRSRLFLVDRDRVRLGAALDLWRSIELYGELTGERRGDVAYEQALDFVNSMNDFTDGIARLPALCSFDPESDPYAFRGSNMSVPVYADLCRLGANVGIRDPFLGGVGSFDLNASWRDGYFQNTARLSSHVGVALADVLWLELGGALEMNQNERVYSGTLNVEPSEDAPDERFSPQATNVLSMDALLSWRIIEGLMLEASYFGFLEDIPFQGDTTPGNGQPYPSPRDTRAYTQTLYARFLYRL